MNQIQQQIHRAHRKWFVIRLIQALGVSLFVGLSVAAIGIAIPKIWHLPFLAADGQLQVWIWSWIAGGVLVGLVAATLWTVLRSGSIGDTAIEVDHRFKLKERLSSALAMTEQERMSKAGKALVNDANDRAETLEVGEQFVIQPSRQLLLPLLPTLILVALIFVPNAAAKEVTEPTVTDARKEIKTAIEETKKKIKKKIEEMEAKGLKDAAENLKSLEKKVDNLSSGLKGDKREALVKLNNVKKQVEDRQRQLGGDSKELKKQLNQLSQINDGPAKKISEAINDGDFKEAKEAIKELLKQLKDGKLSESEKKKLAKDLAKIANEIKKMAERHEQAKEDLQKQLDKANRAGDLEKAAQLQQQLEKMEKQDKQMQKMKKMAENLQKCSNCMKQGDGQAKKGQSGQKDAQQQGNQPSDAQMEEAIESLEDLESMIEQMQDEMQELEDLEDIMDQIEAAKNDCNGCQGNGQKNDKPNWKDWAKGEGPGGGKRDKQETETGNYKSRVKGKVQKGQTVVTGHADGNNVSGKSISEVREIARSSMSKKSDPLENQKLPKSQREHAREYFENLRDR